MPERELSFCISCRIVQSVLALFIGSLTARYLGPANYGLINYASSLVAFFLPFMQLGFNSILVQEIVNHPEKEGETLGTALISSIISSFFCIGGSVAFAAITTHGDTETVLICALYSLILTFQAVELFRYWFQSKLLSKYASISVLVAYLITSVYRICATI